jgi:CBS domain-containing protein
MRCDSCGNENIPGVDLCEQCHAPLTDLDASTLSEPEYEIILEEPLRTVKARDPILVSPETSIEKAVRLLVERGAGCVLVVNDGTLAGIFSERDVLMKVVDDYDQIKDRPISEFMTPNPETLTGDDTIAFALNRMDIGDFRHIPVVDEGKISTVISIRAMTAHIAAKYR